MFRHRTTYGNQVLLGALSNRGIITDANRQEARKILIKLAANSWPEYIAKIKAERVPSYWLDLLDAKNKNEQIRLLKGATITVRQLAAFALEAEQRGFTYSRYVEQHLPKGTDRRNLPRFIEKQEDDSIKSTGSSPMSESQLRQLMNQRNAMVATIFDKGDDWHCVFATYRGLDGKENYKAEQGGQPHYHYISSKWGTITRQQVIDGIRSGKYLSTGVHIDLLDFNSTPPNNSAQSTAPALPPKLVTGTGLPNAAWLGTSGSLYTHYYPANSSVAACGRYSTVAQIQAAGARLELLSKPQCPSCARRLVVVTDWLA